MNEEQELVLISREKLEWFMGHTGVQDREEVEKMFESLPHCLTSKQIDDACNKVIADYFVGDKSYEIGARDAIELIKQAMMEVE